MGDSFNWEWILHCIKAQNRDVVIVSRDRDFGHIAKDGVGYVNDWLAHEVRYRINKRRRIFLVDRLTRGLKLLEVNVTEAEKEVEEVIVQRSEEEGASIAANAHASALDWWSASKAAAWPALFSKEKEFNALDYTSILRRALANHHFSEGDFSEVRKRAQELAARDVPRPPALGD